MTLGVWQAAGTASALGMQVLQQEMCAKQNEFWQNAVQNQLMQSVYQTPPPPSPLSPQRASVLEKFIRFMKGNKNGI